MLRLFAAAGLVAALAAPSLVLGSEAGDLTRDAVYSGALDEGLAKLAPLVAAGDHEAQFGTGLITFVQAVEDLAQALYRHGAAMPDAGPMGPTKALPIAANPNPEPLDYAGVRAILSNMVEQLDAASAVLQQAGEEGDYVLQLDLLQFRIDVDGDNTADDAESLAGIMGAAFGTDPSAFATPDRDKKGFADKSPATADTVKPETPGTGIGFDRADAIWLAGYSQIFAAQGDFFLAHDFHEFVDSIFHRIFPRAGFPMQGKVSGQALALDPETDTAIADLVAAVHTVNWPVSEPERLRRVPERLKLVTSLSRENWDAILAETDDNAELLPSPRQTAIIPDAKVTDEMVAAWLATLDSVDQLLDGKLLIPHWRFTQGFDLKAYFETATRTDVVLLMTGLGALPYLKDGPLISPETFTAADRAFGGNLLGYAFWFN